MQVSLNGILSINIKQRTEELRMNLIITNR